MSLGFIVLDREGEFLAWSSEPETAVRRMRIDDHAEFVYRCADDELIACRRRGAMTPPPSDHPGRAHPFLPDWFG